MVTTRDIMAWLTVLGVDVPLYPGTEPVPEMPDRIGVVFPAHGPGLRMEGLQDVVAFQLRMRGAQNDPFDAETLAYTADTLILNAPTTSVGDARLVAVTRANSRPTPLPNSPDEAGRGYFTGSYLLSLME